MNQNPYNQNPYNNNYNGYQQPPQGGYYNPNPYYTPNRGSYYTPPQSGVYQAGGPIYSPQTAQEIKKQQYYQEKRRKEKNELLLKGVVIGGAILAMLIIEIILVTAMQILGYYELYETSALFENCFNIFAVHICAMAIPFTIMWLILRQKSVPPLIPTKKIGKLKAFMWISFGMGCCMAANFITNFVIQLFEMGGYELSQPEILNAQDPFAAIALVFSTAIVPGIFEEYAMRCCTLGALKKHGKAFGVIAVSVVFGLIHGNLIQFVFAFCVGLVLGYITVKTDNVIPAMLIHGLNNGISVTQEILEYTSGKDVAKTVSAVLVYVWIALAVIGLVYLVVNRELFQKGKKQPKEPSALNMAEKLLCLYPGFLLPFAILIFETLQYITPQPTIAQQIVITIIAVIVVAVILGIIVIIQNNNQQHKQYYYGK